MIDKKTTIITLSILGAVILVVGVVTLLVVQKKHNQVNETTKQILLGNDTSQATYVDLQGNKLALEDFLGEIIVVVSWASWSPFSTNDLTAMEKLAEDYKTKKVKFVAINRKEQKEQATRFLNTLPVLKNIVIAIDTEDLFYVAVGGYAMPESVIFDQRGEIIKHERGIVNVDLIKRTIDELLLNE